MGNKSISGQYDLPLFIGKNNLDEYGFFLVLPSSLTHLHKLDFLGAGV